MIRSRFRRSVHFKFLERKDCPSPGMALEHNGSAEHNGFGLIAWIIIALILIMAALAAHGMAVAINPPDH